MHSQTPVPTTATSKAASSPFISRPSQMDSAAKPASVCEPCATPSKSDRPIRASAVSKRTRNPIRNIVDGLKVQPNPDKRFISLALGDPTTFGNFKIHPSCAEAVAARLADASANGYTSSIGTAAARAAIARTYTRPEAPLTDADVVIASGCSDALNLCIGALCDEDQNILIPAPGFSLYETLASSKGVECRFYHLVPERSWEIDLSHLESLIDDRTAVIVINNPSNPCGSVYSREHLLDILAVAEKHGLPIIADEIYAEMAFRPHRFHPIATLTTTVPVLATGGLAKRFLVPGWRVGWVLVHDRNSRLQDVRKGIVSLSTLTLGANSLIQGALPEILSAPQSFFDETMQQLEANAQLGSELLIGIPGLRAISPQGAMYLMLELQIDKLDGINDDVDFVEKLVQEESVLCLPGKCFRCPGPFVRIVFTPPADQLREAYGRIRSFCERHFIKSCD